MTFLILIIFIIFITIIYSACILSGKYSRMEELEEVKVVIDDLEKREH